MNTTNNAYEVVFESFAERHFIKTFSKSWKSLVKENYPEYCNILQI
jgi:hypothetical protein